MDIPKYVGIVFTPTLNRDGKAGIDQIELGADEAAVRTQTLENYNEAVRYFRGHTSATEEEINQIGWDVYVSTRASANSPDAVHHGFNGPGA